MKALVLIFAVTSLLALCFYDLTGKMPEDDARGVFPAIASAFFAVIAAIDFMFIWACLILRSMS